MGLVVRVGLVAILAAGGYSPNGAVPTAYDLAVTHCTLAVFIQELNAGRVDTAEQGEAMDEAERKCRVALGALMTH